MVGLLFVCFVTENCQKVEQPLISEMAKDDSKGKVDVKSLTSKQYLDKVCILLFS